jgi:hypothetical protein
MGLVGWSAPACAQNNPKTRGAAAKGAPAAQKEAPAAKEAAEAEDEKGEAEAAPPVNPGGTFETFKDERAEKALAVFKSVPGLRDCPQSIINQVKVMAATPGPVDRDTIERFVAGMAYRLIDKANINGLIAPPPGTRPGVDSSRAFKEASADLLDVLNAAKAARNAGFLHVYDQVLIATLPKVLDNNLMSRLEAMIVLGQTGDPSAIPVYINQLKEKNQTVWVKLWAARGITNLVDGGTRVDQVLNVQQASSAAKALADFLEAEKDAPWPAQVRALEGIGAMRQASLPVNLNKVEMSAVAMRLLTDSEATPEVRATAAWALGQVRVNPAVSGYNFALVSYTIGQLAADFGGKAAASFPIPKPKARPAAKDAAKGAGKAAAEKEKAKAKEAANEAAAEDPGDTADAGNPTLSEYLSGLLVGPLFQAFNGLEGSRDSGLLKQPNLGQSASYVKQVADHQSAVARGAVELVRVAPGQVESRKNDLNNRVSALKVFLEQKPPKDFHLVPGGPEYQLEAAPAVKAANDAPVKAAGAPSGR